MVGYYSLTMGNVAAADAARRLVRGLPPVPIVLLARLAIAETHHGQGLGASLLFEALHRAALAAEHAAARLIAVDPIDEPARCSTSAGASSPSKATRVSGCSSGHATPSPASPPTTAAIEHRRDRI